MRVRMIVTSDGSEDGISLRTFNGGQVYDLAPRLAEIFIGGGMAEMVADEVPVKPQSPGTVAAIEKPAAKRATKRATGPKENKAK